MESVYDWVTVAIFAGLVVLFVQRSTGEEEAHQHDSLPMYLVAAVGCAIANYVGNKGLHIVAVPLILATLGFIVYFLKPFKFWPRS